MFTHGSQLVRFILAIAVAVGAFVFFVAPTRYTVDELHETIVQEHGLQVATFGEAPAERVLERFSRYRRIGVGGAVGDRDSDPTTGFLRSEYGRSLGALLLLCLYRVSAIVELLLLVLPFLVVFMVDGLVTRSVRALEFVPHSAGVYGTAYLALVAVFCVTVVAMCVPMLVHPLLFAPGPLVAAALAGRAAANFHKQG